MESEQAIDNKVDYRQLIQFMSEKYTLIDKFFLESLNADAGGFYMRDFDSINIRSLRGFDLHRMDFCRLIRVITGYPYTNQYLYKIGLMDSPECECGFVNQDMNHILWACPRFQVQREDFINFLIHKKLFPPFSIQFLLANLEAKIAKNLVKFFNSTNLKL